eukprot:CAMPEP_0180217458 /NCGR_PEP_ID=MMETSP0987-20121128/16963_1 /TAXON_ID=697907 /ORGANISM="non described non described, Strain CCMP2293" /LENGTH=184 /DNA_ID=CAMNT_0022177031 /DNA_START=14 /DNA_END=565 /DNA_ORIENTATION=-
MAGVATALELFPEAVRSVFERWTALNLAVSHNWGDGDSLSKREELITNCCGGFMNGKKIDPTEVEDFLDGYMLANYTTEADDESPKEVSYLLCRIYDLLAAGQLEEAQNLLASPIASLDKCVKAPNFDSDAEESSAGESGDDDDEMEEEPKVEEKVTLTEEQQADVDDGWGVVVKSNKGRTKMV